MHVYGSFENFRRFSMHVLGSQTENFLSQKGQRSFCLNCEILYFYHSAVKFHLLYVKIDFSDDLDAGAQKVQENLRRISAKEL